jgi:tetratricopeptide (TPR) repeat protein
MRVLRKRFAIAVFAVLFVIVPAVAARAATSAADQAAAAALFAEARRLLDEGRPAEACPKLEESQKLDPAAGTALNLGDCFEQIGRTASAYGAFDQAAALARRSGDMHRAEEAERRARALEPNLAKITVIVPEASRLPGLSVLRDGRSLGAGQWEVAVPVDAGPHTVEAAAPGRRPWKATVQVSSVPGTVQVTVPELSAAKEPRESPEGRPVQRFAGIAVGSLGLGGLLVGGGLAIAAAAKNEASFKHCLPDDPNKCYAKGVVLRNESIRFADTSTVVTSISAVALAVGTTLFLTAGAPRPPERPARVWVLPHVSPQTAGLSFGAAW